jgi:hypothetical protein
MPRSLHFAQHTLIAKLNVDNCVQILNAAQMLSLDTLFTKVGAYACENMSVFESVAWRNACAKNPELKSGANKLIERFKSKDQTSWFFIFNYYYYFFL